MKSKIVLLLTVLFVSVSIHAQFGGLLNKVKNKVNQRADQKTDKQIDKMLDKAEGKKTEGTSDDKKEGAGDDDKKSISIKSFSKYDFVPGEKIMYYDNFESEAIAELPQGWNTNGSGEVVTLENISGKWLKLHKGFTYFTANQQTFDENFTLEFDMLLQLKNNGWAYPEISAGVFASGEESNTGNNFLKEYDKNAAVLATVYPAEFNNSRVTLSSFNESKSYFKSEAKSYNELEKYYGQSVHVAMQIQKERFRMWINETKVFDVPKAVPLGNKMNQLLFKVNHTNYAEEQYGVYISNIKVAQGIPDTRHKLAEEGKFSTAAILFDVNAATIKPESAGVLKEIAAVFKQFADIKVKIIGHTDSDGKDADNLELSKKRAAVVKDVLVNEYGIEESRIETDGKGETIPVADNKTKEGKAQNRRVEFVKL